MSERLPIPVRKVLREPFDEARIDAAIHRVRLAPRSRPRGAPLMIGAGSLALAAAAALAFMFRGSLSEGPIRLESGAVLTALSGQSASSEYLLDDGSRIRLDSNASIEALANDAHEVVLVARGTSTFDIRPHGPRRWTIECGLATVVVIGTQFTIERSPRRLRVSVDRGAVLVRGERVPEHARRLEAGDDIVITDEVVSTVAVHPPSLPENAATEQPIEPANEPTTEPSPPTRRWRELAAEGAWERAYAELGARGIVREAPRATVDDLLALADIARLSGHPADAVAPLERILREHASDPNAALAAFTLGRLESDHLGRRARAMRALERALELGLPAALRTDAIARLTQLRQTADAEMDLPQSPNFGESPRVSGVPE